MAPIIKPVRQVSFSTLKQVPADRLDSQIENLVQAISSTQTALAELRRDDGKLKNGSVGREQLTPDVARKITDDLIAHTSLMAVRAEQGAATARHAGDEIQLYARDAEAAAISAAQFMSAVGHAQKTVIQARDTASNDADSAEVWASDSENWANYSQSQASNAEVQQQQAAGWAEYLAGPVVNPEDAPAYIQGTPFGHGLYYQPVEGYGGNGGLWSAKWWAIYAAQLVGPWSFYYLGGWADPPVPGSSNPDTGIAVPSPIPPGSFYYDTDTDTVYFWNGSAWVSPYVLASGVTSRFVYLATAGQTVFTGQDYNGATPNVGQSPSDVHLNGVKLVPALDYTIAGNTLTLAIPATVNSVVQWDLLVPAASLTPSGVHAYKTTITGVVDGANRNYTLQYNHPTDGLQPVATTNAAQLQVCLDGIIQEPGSDYIASTNTLTMSVAPPVNSHFWIVWFSTAVTPP